MANYPEVTSWRMAYDVDGTQVFDADQNPPQIPYDLTASEVAAMNREDPSLQTGEPVTTENTWRMIIFPELRDLDGIGSSSGPGPGAEWDFCQVSGDTTNGIDGTWVSYPFVQTFSKTGFRTDISWNTVLNVKAVRLGIGGNNEAGSRYPITHLYGEPSPGENLQRLEIWHPTLDQRLGPADLDWGDIPRNTTETREFRVKNMDPVLTANSVRAAMSIITDTTPSVVGQQAISKDGSTWASQQTLASPLGPEDISPIMYIRRTTPSNATLSLWWYRLFADCTSWT
jgi:hypothetical protein